MANSHGTGMILEGIINLDKPAGLTSARAVSRVKRLLGGKVKVGHAGTLDPFATGVLLVLVGRATKTCEQLMGLSKTYDAVVHLGATTPTDDVDSQETAWPGAAPIAIEAIHETLAQFVGETLQKPPAYSALKVGGRRAYVLARLGRAPKLSARMVRIDSIELLSYYWPLLSIRVRCGRGTYIRALARDIGEKLNVGGYLTALRRTSIGAFDVSSAVSLESLASQGVASHFLPIPSFSEPAPSPQRT
jgi:tRNA pseudouridine55 synthase